MNFEVSEKSPRLKIRLRRHKLSWIFNFIKKLDRKYEKDEKLQVVEIYFDTPTFDKITRDAKTNSIAKLSLIGGTLGLLTGK